MSHVPDLLTDHAAALTPRDEMVAWVVEVVGHGIRRPGTAAGRRVEDWVVDRLREVGVEDVHREPMTVPTWTHGVGRLVAWPAGRPAEAIDLPGFPLPYTAASAGLEADVVAWAPGDPDPAAARGAIAVEVVDQLRLPQDLVAAMATGGHDPGGELAGTEHVLPFGPRLGKEVDAAVEAGAAAYVGVLAGMPWTTRDYYVPYDAVERPLPGVWLDREDGARLTRLLAAGPVRGRIEVDGQVGTGATANVVGTLPGASDDWVVIGSHHDAPWASAVEDGTGIALVLAQARFWAQVPAERRPHNLMFLLNGAHLAGGAGLTAFAERHAALLDRVVVSVHLEHAAAACRVEGGRLVATGDPEVAWWFTSRDPDLEKAVVGALESEGLRRSWVLPPEAFGEFPPTDGGPIHTRGVPLVDFLSAPVYLFDACDTLDKVHEPSLEPLSRAVVRIVGSLAGRSAADVRAGVAAATGGAGVSDSAGVAGP